MKVYIVIPTYNEAKTIGWLVKRIKAFPVSEVVVVDDGSLDKTAEIAQRSGATVLCNTKNLGKGKALKAGFDYCLASACDAVVTLDGDGQHNPEEIPSLIEYCRREDIDIVVGNRMHFPEDMPWLRLLTNRFMSRVISLLVRQEIPDTQCGLRLLKREVLERLDLQSSNFEIESEILIQAKRKGFRIESLPIKTIYSPDIVSQINPFLDTLRFLKFILKMLWQ
jgi:glycosyltransferase involved in cell wall biosynthesis